MGFPVQATKKLTFNRLPRTAKKLNSRGLVHCRPSRFKWIARNNEVAICDRTDITVP